MSAGRGGAGIAPARRALATAIVVAVAAGCRIAPPPPDAIATIGERVYRYDDLERYVKTVAGEGGEGLAAAALSRLLDQYLDEELLRRVAADRKLVPPAAPAAQAAEALLESSGGVDVSDADVRRYYAAHAAEFARPERVRLRQVLVPDRATAEKARAAVLAGEDFAAVARRLSEDPSALRGGDQGELAREDLPPAFAELIFALQPGEVSEVVAADYGFHLFQVLAKLPAQTAPFATVAPEIRDRLERERADEKLAALVGEARRHYNVAVYARNLPFAYRGSFSGSP